MCYSNASTSKNVDLSKRYKKSVPQGLAESPVFFASGFTFPTWRVITTQEEIQSMHWGLIPSWFKKATPKDIAAKTGFSPTTISLVLNNKKLAKYISASTKEIVKQAGASDLEDAFVRLVSQAQDNFK